MGKDDQEESHRAQRLVLQQHVGRGSDPAGVHPAFAGHIHDEHREGRATEARVDTDATGRWGLDGPTEAFDEALVWVSHQQVRKRTPPRGPDFLMVSRNCSRFLSVWAHKSASIFLNVII